MNLNFTYNTARKIFNFSCIFAEEITDFACFCNFYANDIGNKDLGIE